MIKALLTLLSFLVLSQSAQAQLTGTDIKPGDSCAASEEGYVARNASADRDVSEITLICDGSQWQSATGGNSDTLAGLSCASGQLAKWNGTAWACAADDAGSGGGGFGGSQLFTASGTFVVPDGVTTVKVSLIGGGGSGGRCGTGSMGGGGGAGGTAVGWLTVTPGANLSVTVGEGGAGRSSAGNGFAGTASAFETMTANGGARGTGSSNCNATNPPGGVGGTASGGTFNVTGGKGANGTTGVASAAGDANQILQGLTYGDGSPGNNSTVVAAKDGMVLIEW